MIHGLSLHAACNGMLVVMMLLSLQQHAPATQFVHEPLIDPVVEGVSQTMLL